MKSLKGCRVGLDFRIISTKCEILKTSWAVISGSKIRRDFGRRFDMSVLLQGLPFRSDWELFSWRGMCILTLIFSSSEFKPQLTVWIQNYWDITSTSEIKASPWRSWQWTSVLRKYASKFWAFAIASKEYLTLSLYVGGEEEEESREENANGENERN